MKEGLVQVTTSDVPAGCDHPGTEARVWVARIMECWRHSVESIIRTGQRLNEAKRALNHGQWSEVRASIPFGERQVQMLMAIASDRRLSNPQYIALLPASWGTIYDVTRLEDDQLERGFREGIIRPEMERGDVEILRPARSAPPRIAQPMSDEEILGSDGIAEGREAQDRRQAEGVGPDRESLEVGSLAQMGERGPTQGLRSGVRSSDESVGVESGPSEAIMPRGGLAIAHRRDEGHNDPREFFPTPPWGTRALVERVLRHLGREGHCKHQKAWEPACGEGHMAEVLKEYFRSVDASDAYPYDYRGDKSAVFPCDFLTVTQANAVDWIITNPPFRRSTDFVLKAIELAGTGVAMFVRLAWIEGVNRYQDLLKDNPPSLLSIFTERVPLHKARWEPDGSTFTSYAWIIWIKGMPPQPPFWIPPGCRKALAKPDDVKRFGKTEIEEAEAA